MIAVALNAQRVGLLPRWMGMLGMFASVIQGALQKKGKLLLEDHSKA